MNEQGLEIRENAALGIAGAVIGALIGGALWVLIGQLGFIAGIAGLAIVFLSFKGYKMLGKTMSRKGIIICVVLSALMILLAEYFSLGYIIYDEFKNYYAITLMDAIGAVPDFMGDGEVQVAIIKDLVVGYALTALVSVGYIKSAWNDLKPKVIENYYFTDEASGSQDESK